MMAPDIARAAVWMALSSSAAIVLVALLRRPLRLAAGAESAYWVWLLVPVSAFAVLAPAPSKALRLATGSFSIHLGAMLKAAPSPLLASATAFSFAGLGLAIWLAGAALLLVTLLHRQVKFIRALGELRLDSQGVGRSDTIRAPVLVGARKPFIVVPIDFDARYSPEERMLILEHERAHLARGDLIANGFAALWLCLSWFNPLAYLAMAWLRQDQELACDAKVLNRTQSSPRRYAQALLKTQLLDQSAWHVPIACHWHSVHPLTERVAMLKRPLPGVARRLIGTTMIGVLTLAGGYTSWAASQEAPSSDSTILVHLKLTATDSEDSNKKRTVTQETEYLAKSGELVNFPMHAPYDVRCVVSLPGKKTLLPAENTDAGTRIPVLKDGQIQLECMIREDGKVVATPALITSDGEEARVDLVNPDRPSEYLLEVRATTSKLKIDEARASAEKR